MADRPASHPALRTKQQQFVERILAACREGRLNVRALPNSLLYEHHRHGLRTIAVKTTDLGPVQMETVLRYRLGQYIAHGQIDPALVWQCRWRNEPLSNVHPEDIHVCALDAEVGTILCYLTIRTLGEVGDALMIDRSRPLFPVEKVFGRVYDSIPWLAAVRVAHVRELGRLIKNCLTPSRRLLIARAPLEVGLAAVRLVTSGMAGPVRACVGDLEDSVAGRFLRTLDIPATTIGNARVQSDTAGLLSRRFATRNCHPFVIDVAEVGPSRRRTAIEKALSEEGGRLIPPISAIRRNSPSCASTPTRSMCLPIQSRLGHEVHHA